MKKWMIRVLSVLLIAAFLPMSVLADEYDLSEGSVTVSTTKGADGSTKQEVTHKDSTKEDSNPTISSSGKTDNTITIKADAGTTANVTIKDTNIDSLGTSKAAVKTEGKGDVNLNVEGKNTVYGDEGHAGVEKSNEGNLTIGSESGSGELTAKGGSDGAGIGGGNGSDGTDITITGGEVYARGGASAAGIGGGQDGSGSDVTVSGDAFVRAGSGNGISGLGNGDGASIGSGGKSDGSDGEEVTPDTSGLYTTGKVELAENGWTDTDVTETITGTVDPPKPDEPENPTEPEKSASSEDEADKREPLYRVLHLDGSALKHQAEKADGILALTADADGAILTGTLRALGYLQNQGVEKITFTDGTHSAELVLADLIAKGEPEDVYVLTLGTENTLTLNGEAMDF